MGVGDRTLTFRVPVVGNDFAILEVENPEGAPCFVNIVRGGAVRGPDDGIGLANREGDDAPALLASERHGPT